MRFCAHTLFAPNIRPAFLFLTQWVTVALAVSACVVLYMHVNSLPCSCFPIVVDLGVLSVCVCVCVCVYVYDALFQVLQLCDHRHDVFARHGVNVLVGPFLPVRATIRVRANSQLFQYERSDIFCVKYREVSPRAPICFFCRR